ncbi:MAG: VOC family protein [Polyangiaceae bacterium]|nr:VOC family protein [Polyangiaceae bacterium]
MLQGLRSAIYYVSDLEKATAWYTQVLGIAPYFSEPFYVGFNVGGFELGLHPDPEASLIGLGGAVPYWGVADASAAHDRLVTLGAESLRPVQDVGGGIRVAVVKDPFGNALGIIENPHFALPA